MFLPSPAFIISHAAPDATAMNSSMCGSIVTFSLLRLPAGMWMCPEIQLAPPRIGYVRVELCRGEIGVPEHFLNGSEVRASLEQVSREGVPKDVRMDTSGVEAGHLGQPAEDQERAGTGERPAFRVEE
jgi:hypothetical protein